MKGLVRAPGLGSCCRRVSLLALLQCAFLSQLTIPSTAARYQDVHEVVELHRSMARYRELFQVNENQKLEDPEIGGSKVEQDVVVQNDGKIQEPTKPAHEISKEKSNFEKTARQEQPVVDEFGEQEQPQQGKEKAAEEQTVEEEEPFIFPEPYLLGPTIDDWDEQRGGWLDENPDLKTTADGKPRVLIVTGSQQGPCRAPDGDNFHMKSLKIKIDYARMHNYEIYYNFAWLDPLFGSYWVKLPTIRKLMLTHPEIEWFFWVDSDAVFTDMLFEPPLHTYDTLGYNFVMWGHETGLFEEKSWTSYNAGVFMIRNCQWSLDLIDKWSPMGIQALGKEYGKLIGTVLLDRTAEHFWADDQSALGYLILTDEAIRAKVKLIESPDYCFSGWWIQLTDKFEDFMENYHPGLGSNEKWPWITHFTGCGPCGQDHTTSDYAKCLRDFNRAYNFADNQVLAYMGFQHQNLSSPAVIRTRNETDRPLDFVGVNPWQDRIAQLAAAAGGAVSNPLSI